MKLKKINLENFRCFESIEISFASRLNIIVGNNGGGKTTVLDAVATALGVVPTHLPDISGVSFKKSDLRVKNGNIALYAKIEAQTFDGLSWDRTIRRDKSKTTTKSLPKQKGTKELLGFLDENIIDRYNKKEKFTLPLFVYYGVSRAILDIPLTRKGFSKEQKRFQAFEESLKAVSRFKKAFVWFYNKENEENRLQKEQKSFDVTLKELDVVREAISSMFPDLSEPHIEVNPLRFMIKKDGEPLSLNQLSDGYKTMLGLVIDLSSRLAVANPDEENPLDTEGIVMIDEVDLHLHPSWQSRVLNDLLRTFANTQFIVTTHSPYIVESLNNNLKKAKIDTKLQSLYDTRDDLVAIKELISIKSSEVNAYMIDDFQHNFKSVI